METLVRGAAVALVAAIGYGFCTQGDFKDQCQAALGDARTTINDLFAGFEAWQIMGLTVCGCIVLDFIINLFFGHEESLFTRTKKGVFRCARKIPLVQRMVEKELSKTRADFEKSLLHKHAHPNGITAMPKEGRKWDDLEKLLQEYAKIGDPDKRREEGKVSGTIYVGDDDVDTYTDMISKTYAMFAWTNPLHPGVFPGVRQMEAEVVRMVCDIFNGGPTACGSVTSGGTESILLACKSYRDYYHSVRGITNPNIVTCTTAHPAFDKACQYLGIHIRKIPMDPKTCRARPSAMRRHIDSNTIALVGSCPQYPHGCVDPIEELAAIAKSYGIGLHVDCCLGSFVVPFMRKAGFDFPSFDFTVDGVTSISADTHKFGYAPKGSSVVMYSFHELHHAQYSMFPDWPGGVYGTPTIAGSRSGALVAATWAALVHHGEDGYVKCTQKIIKAAREIAEGIKKIPGLRLMCEPDGPVVSWTSDVFDVYRMTHGLIEEHGWDLNVLQFPPSIHICVTLAHTREGIVESFLNDMAKVAAPLFANPGVKAEGGAAVYGMAQSIPDRTIIEDVVKTYLDTTYLVPA
ncbi:uncharacterized protein MONBRDRAFT_32346 [Monosiga brevicollis MX1]|uniref:sphinganine-1-phosphate aldolase n=1 Tax=Monosiga brevicollis TaxID=81824 RepID=A9UYY0_MONBE|nr:uncharacterized protein MONBRDRAFT_32346 [Monosiga brevicollis MX1]EDQ89686.1 predicted protein [Monosiga brevicollis MX1]|eukprot:XP_001745715.1 hypothetical protein [Monosiga brevicollis MX1]